MLHLLFLFEFDSILLAIGKIKKPVGKSRNRETNKCVHAHTVRCDDTVTRLSVKKEAGQPGVGVNETSDPSQTQRIQTKMSRYKCVTASP